MSRIRIEIWYLWSVFDLVCKHIQRLKPQFYILFLVDYFENPWESSLYTYAMDGNKYIITLLVGQLHCPVFFHMVCYDLLLTGNTDVAIIDSLVLRQQKAMWFIGCCKASRFRANIDTSSPRRLQMMVNWLANSLFGCRVSMKWLYSSSSSSTALSGVGSRGQPPRQRCPDFPAPSQVTLSVIWNHFDDLCVHMMNACQYLFRFQPSPALAWSCGDWHCTEHQYIHQPVAKFCYCVCLLHIVIEQGNRMN